MLGTSFCLKGQGKLREPVADARPCHSFGDLLQNPQGSLGLGILLFLLCSGDLKGGAGGEEVLSVLVAQR